MQAPSFDYEFLHTRQEKQYLDLAGPSIHLKLRFLNQQFFGGHQCPRQYKIIKMLFFKDKVLNYETICLSAFPLLGTTATMTSLLAM